MTTSDSPPIWKQVEAFADWALDTPDQRQAKRRNSSKEEIVRFYAGVQPHLEAILKACDAYPLGKLPASHRQIYNLALALAEAAPHVELYRGDPAVPYAFAETRFIAHHGADDTWRGAPPYAHDR
jgi:hypothetical protein